MLHPGLSACTGAKRSRHPPCNLSKPKFQVCHALRALRALIACQTHVAWLQVDDDTKAALRYVTGITSSLREGASGGAARSDARTWRAVAALARRERENLGGAVRHDREAMTRADGVHERDVLIAKYAVVKKVFLDARIEQLDKRTAALETG